MRSKQGVGCVACVLLCAAVCASAGTVGVLRLQGAKEPEYQVYFDVPYSATLCAWAEYNDTLSETGWGSLSVRGREADLSEAQFCSGIAEAALTHTRISQHFSVTYASLLEELGGSLPLELVAWLETSVAWTRKMAEQHRASDAYWEAVYGTLRRFDGLAAGYKQFRDPREDEEISELGFVLLQSAGDLDDLTAVVSKSMPELRKKVTSAEWRDLHHHCTGLVYVAEHLEDVYVAHDSWCNYNTMNRMLKDYEVTTTAGSSSSSSSSGMAATRWTFSSNAGMLLSMDDFWVLNSGLVVIETTVHTWNTTLYDLYCRPESVLSWIRVNAANQVARDGQEWAKYFNIANSWTYNNQYFVLDTSKFVRGKRLLPGFLVAAEQVPGHYVTGDRTDELAERRWVPSINTPYYAEVYNASGYPEQVAQTQCDYWSYERCARHLIMKRDVVQQIRSYADFQRFMRSNNWQTDPLSNGDAAEAILSRYDLRPKECLHQGTMTQCPAPFGGVDAKTTTIAQARALAFDAISSPQYEKQQPWEFGTARWPDVRYDGLPKRWTFPWVKFAPIDH